MEASQVKAALQRLAGEFKGWTVKDRWDVAPNGEIVTVGLVLGTESKNTRANNLQAGYLRTRLMGCNIPHTSEASYISVNPYTVANCTCCEGDTEA